MLPNKRKVLSGSGITLGVAILCSSCLIAIVSVIYFFDGWGILPSPAAYVCLLCSAMFGGFLIFYVEKKYTLKSNFIFQCVILGALSSLLFISCGGAAHVLYLDWYMSCKSKNARSCYSVGQLYKNDLLFWGHPETAKPYFRKSCRDGSWGGCINALENSSSSVKAACEMFSYCSEVINSNNNQLQGKNTYNSIECQLYDAKCPQN